MISEHQFASGYASLWDKITPLSGGYWNTQNLLLTREAPALPAVADIHLRSVINEAAFRAFAAMAPSRGTVTDLTIRTAVHDHTSDAIDYVARFAPAIRIDAPTFDQRCAAEAAALTSRLLGFFSGRLPLHLKPSFPGCGIVSTCEGDVIEGNCLYEVKAGDRPFRITDVRQLLTYSALAYASRTFSFTRIGLYNPRTGLAWVRTLNEVCQSIAGSRPPDVLSALVTHFSASSVSR